MLKLLTKSRIRQRIILLFIYNPGKSYYINEIARLIKTSAGNVQRELRKLQEAGFLERDKKGNAVYFKINELNPLLPEIKTIVDKTIGLEKILAEELKEIKSIQFAFLFGSYVKGDFDSDSDIDLYIIGDINEKELHVAVRRAEEAINREINYHFSIMNEFKEKLKSSFFHKEIAKNYILIIGNENEFRKIVK